MAEMIEDVETEEKQDSRIVVPYPGADEKYEDGHKDWRIYNPSKYHDPLWSPDKE